MTDDRTFPMLDGPSIPWRLAEIVYEVYHDLFHDSQTLEEIAARGGFGWAEVTRMGEMLKKRRGYDVYNTWKSGAGIASQY
jgi:hypothetical protein